jgi:hypothetical protein
MMDMPVTVQGTLKPDGTLELAQKLTLPPGQVMVTVQPMPTSTPWRTLMDVMDEIRRRQKARGFQGRSAEEIDAGLQEGEAEYEQRMQALQAQTIRGGGSFK